MAIEEYRGEHGGSEGRIPDRCVAVLGRATHVSRGCYYGSAYLCPSLSEGLFTHSHTQSNVIGAVLRFMNGLHLVGYLRLQYSNKHWNCVKGNLEDTLNQTLP